MIILLYTLWVGTWNYIRGRGYSDRAYKIVNTGLRIKSGEEILKKVIDWKKCYWLALSKFPCYLYIALPLCAINALTAICVFIGLFLPSLAGWGKAMQAINHSYYGKPDVINNEKEFLPVDYITNKICEPATDFQSARIKALVWGAVFGMIAYAPLWIGLAYLVGEMGYIFQILTSAVFGVIVYSVRRWEHFEFIWGALLGLLIIAGLV